MFGKILIANRGEIAVRIARACRALGVRSVAIYSEADVDALHVRVADEAHPCGPARATESYLDIPGIVAIAQRCGAEAIHPGYGFLSENPDFAQAVIDAGLVFIGPAPDVIRAMGGKIPARERMREAGVRVVPGGRRAISDVESARREAADFGYPVIVKASAGGGGRGMRRVNDEDELEAALERAASEALAAFGGRHDLPRKISLRPAPHRDPDPRRPARQDGPSRRTRVLDPAPPPEGRRRGACLGHDGGRARGDGRSGGPRGAGGRLRRGGGPASS
jgi:acetyl/propionyl-CoA carboxylase alpha subunit